MLPVPPHVLSLADLSVAELQRVIRHSHYLSSITKPWLLPFNPAVPAKKRSKLRLPSQSLFNKNIALLFSKRSTRTRLASETAAGLLGGRALFLGREDIQLGVNESVRDSARVIGGMAEGIFARVGKHEEVEELAKYSPVPVINALSDYWHPTQVLADLLTLHQNAHLFGAEKKESYILPDLPPLTVTYVGDSANVLHDMLVTYPRLGHQLRVATPAKYRAPSAVWDRVVQLGCDKAIFWSDDPKEAVAGADLVVTDTWISMGQEHEKEQRLKDFAGYQVTEDLCKQGGAKPDWKFMHCLPRKEHEVDDEVFYGPRSLVFPEADNRKWSIMGLFDLIYGRWSLSEEPRKKSKD